MFVRCEQPDAIQATFPEAYEEAAPAFLAFACALACSEYLPVAVFGHPYRDKYRDAGHFAAPAALQVDAVNEHVGVFPAYGPVSPFLDLAVYLLVQVAHRRSTHARAPQELRDVFHAAHGYPRQVHLDERLLHGRFPAPVALDDGGLERGQAQLGYGQVDLSGGSQKLAVVMTAAVVPALVCPLMPFRVAQLRGFLVQHRVEGFLDGLSNDSFQVVPEIFLVNFDYIVIHRMLFF